MAKQGDADNPRGRLLFTDFELTGKGRPPGASLGEPDAAAVLAKPLPSLKDVISSLDIGFEADDDETSSPSFPSTEQFRYSESAAEDAGTPDEDAWDQDILDAPLRKSDPTDERLGAFLSTFSPEPADRQDARETDIPNDDGDLELDFAALLAASARPQRKDFHPGDDEAGAASAMRRDESEGEEDETSPLDHILDNLDSEGDLLSMLPNTPSKKAHPAQRRKRKRTEFLPPPRQRPYGGIKRLDAWYRPPEEEAEEEIGGKVKRVENWFEPPPDPKSSGTTQRFRQSDLDRKAASAESAEDLFSAFDLEQEWNKRRAQAKNTADSDEYLDTADDFLFAEFDEILNSYTRDEAEEADDEPPGENGNELPEDDIMSMVKPLPNSETVALPRAETPTARDTDAGTTAEAEAKPKRPTASKPVVEAVTFDEPSAINVELAFADDEENEAASPPVKTTPPTIEATAPAAAVRVQIPPPAVATEDIPAAAFPDSPSATEDGLESAAVPPGDAKAETADGAANAAITDLADADEVAHSLADDLPRKEPEGTYSDIDLDALADAAGDAVDPDVAPPVISDDDLETDTQRMRRSAASEDDYLPGAEEVDGSPRRSAPAIGEEGDAEKEHADSEAAAVNPLDVFANMDNLDDFRDDGLDDEMKAMLADDEAVEEKSEGATRTKAKADAVAAPARRTGKVWKLIYALTDKFAPYLPMERMRAVGGMLSWRQNWWFYCDLLAAVIATASLAVIVSYFLWYRK